MKQAISIALIFLCIGILSCGKGSGDDECNDTGLEFTTTPALNTTEQPAVGPDFPVTVTITSSVPSQGVTIVVTARAENPSNSQPFYTETRSITTSSTTFTITNTPQQVPSIVEITATANNCNTNKFSGTYRYSRK
jgi:hypothetical protein